MRRELDLRLPGGRLVSSGQLTWRTSTSGGPGGQHANRTASRVVVSVRIADLPLDHAEVARIYERLASRITGAGELSAAASDTRDQHRNRRIALGRLEALIAQALRTSRPRLATSASAGVQLRRREQRQQRAQRKRERRQRWDDGEA